VYAVEGATFDDLDPYSTGPSGAWSQALPPERQRVFLTAADILERRADASTDRSVR
jgi:hypothetical protein